MKYIIVCALITGCASQPPVILSEVHSHMKMNGYLSYAASDYRPMKSGESGNCARFAASYYNALKERGVESQIKVCMIDEKTAHAFAVADGWALDNRFIAPVRVDEVGCIGEIKNMEEW